MIHEETNYIYGVHCGDANCYSCTTMKGECAWLDAKDKLEDEKNLDVGGPAHPNVEKI